MKWMLMPLRRYAEFGGRSRRMEYWMFALFLVIVYILFLGALIATGFPGRASGGAGFGAVVVVILFTGLFWLATLLPGIAVQVRRLHDTDRSGWWVMLWAGPMIVSNISPLLMAATQSVALVAISVIASLAFFIGCVVLLVFYCLPGTRGENRFGPDPLGDTTESLAETFA